MSQPVYDIGAEAGRLLLDRIAEPGRRPIHRKLRTQFIERDSVAAPVLRTALA
jgi:LacI family transcriptional regulator